MLWADFFAIPFYMRENNASLSLYIGKKGAEALFDILDYDESGCLDMNEFIEGMMRARGEARRQRDDARAPRAVSPFWQTAASA